MQYDFGEKLRVFHTSLRHFLRSMAADLTAVAPISKIVGSLLWIPYVSSNVEGIYALYLKRTVMNVK